MHVVLTYDVVDNKRRTKFHKKLKRYLLPVQKSVFEGVLPVLQYQQVLDLVHAELDLSTDSIRIYSLCKNCVGLVEALGTAPELEDPEAPIIY